MDLPNVPLELSNLHNDVLKETFIQQKLTDSASSVQNSSEVVILNVHEESLNSLPEVKIQHTPHPQIPIKIEQGENKNAQSEDDSSQESGESEIKGVVKSGREQKFKRSTNNSHKKFISVARRWLFKNHRGELKVAFQNKFHNFRSTRTYFFIILAFIRTIMNEQKQRQFQTHFTKQVTLKILEYEKQIQNTTNENLKHFRADEVTDLKFSIKACDVYFEGDLDKSIECVYKKDKVAIVKKHHYEEALKTVRGIEEEFRNANFLENTINAYGGKKVKRKWNENEDLQKKEVNERQQRSRFFVAEMFGLKVGYVSETFYSSRRYREMSAKQNIELPKMGEEVQIQLESLNKQVLWNKEESLKGDNLEINKSQKGEWVDGRKIVKVILVPVSKKIEEQIIVKNQTEVIQQFRKADGIEES